MTDNRAPMAAAILNAIIDTNRDPLGEVFIDAEHAKEAIMMALAAMMEADPDLRTAEDIASSVQTFGLELMDKIAAMRAAYERTGRRMWNAEIVRQQ